MSKRREICIFVDSTFLRQLQNRIEATTQIEVVRVAFTILDWASGEAKRRRIILSSGKEGEDLHRLVMPELEQVRVAA